MRRFPAALVALSLFIAPANAVDQGGSIAAWGDYYPTGDPEIQGWFRGTYALDARPAPWFFVKLAVYLEHDSHGEIDRDDLYDDADRGLKRAPLRFRDLALGFHAGETTVAIGRQRLTWQRTTFVNATDNLVPRDWTDPLDPARLSPYAANVAWEHDRFTLEGALVPKYAPSRLPQLNGRWFSVPPLALSWGTAEFPPVSWDTLQGAVRGGVRGSAGELRLSYFRGFDDAPRVDPVGTVLNRRFLKLEVAGIDGEVLAGPFVIRGEAGYFHYPGEAADGYGLFQVECEWSRSEWRLIGGYGDDVGGGATGPAISALDQAFLPAVFFFVERGALTEWQVSFEATIGTKELDSLVRLQGSYPVTSHVRLAAEMDVISGNSQTFWGRWRDNDRLRAMVKLDF